MDDSFDDSGAFIGAEEYSDSAGSDPDSWEDVEETAEDNAVVKSLYGPNVEVAHYKHDTQDARQPLVSPETPVFTKEIKPKNWEFQKGLMDSAPGLLRNITVLGHVNHGKSSFVELFTGPHTTDTSIIEKRRHLTLALSCHTTLVQNSTGKSYVLNIVDTPGHTDYNDEVQRSRLLASNTVHVVDAVEGPVLSRFSPADVVILNKIDKLILDLRLPPNLAFDRLRLLVEDELSIDPMRVVFMSVKFGFAFTLKSFASMYALYQDNSEKISLWSSTNFVSYVLNPLYKLFNCGLLGAESSETLATLNIVLDKNEWLLDYEDRTRLILQKFFEDPNYTAVTDTLLRCTEPPACGKPEDAQLIVAKQVAIDRKIFSLVRVAHGILESGKHQSLFVPAGPDVIAVEAIHCGNWALIDRIRETSAPLNVPLVKVGVEPLRDSLGVLEAMANGLETLIRVLPALQCRVLETGEYCIWGPGELYVDHAIQNYRELTGCAMHVGIPSAQLMETVSEQSSTACVARSAAASVTMIVSPLPAEVLERLDVTDDAEATQPIEGLDLQGATGTVWATYKGNILSDELSPPLLTSVDADVKSAVIAGFQWACREGPLMEDAVRGVRFTITEAQLNSSMQVVPTVRRACHAAMLVASPRLLEPWMRATIIGRLSAGKAVYKELAKRRGKVVSDRAVVGTNLYITRAVLPLMDSFGFEIDVLCNVPQRNEAQVNLEFCGWRVVDGDPLDASKGIPRLKPAEGSSLARDYMMKTRRRKGLISEISLARYLEDDVAAGITSSKIETSVVP